jgi:signal transduction protein with GAF and PtsI domain
MAPRALKAANRQLRNSPEEMAEREKQLKKDENKSKHKSKSKKKLAKKDSSGLSDKTKKHLDKASNYRTKSTVNNIKAAPGVAYGVADIVAGEKVSGVASLAKVAPTVAKGTMQDCKSRIEQTKATVSAINDMKGQSLDNKVKIGGELVAYNVKSQVDSIKNVPSETMNETKQTIQNIGAALSNNKNKLNNMPEPTAIGSKSETKNIVDKSKMQQDAQRLNNNLLVSNEAQAQAEI